MIASPSRGERLRESRRLADSIDAGLVAPIRLSDVTVCDLTYFFVNLSY
jgi:hypothetical protein